MIRLSWEGGFSLNVKSNEFPSSIKFLSAGKVSLLFYRVIWGLSSTEIRVLFFQSQGEFGGLDRWQRFKVLAIMWPTYVQILAPQRVSEIPSGNLPKHTARGSA